MKTKTESKTKPRELSLAELTGVVGGMDGDPITINPAQSPGPIIITDEIDPVVITG